MIHRLDLGLELQAKDAGVSYDAAAPTQVLWTAIGVALFVALIVVIRDHRILQRYAYTLALVGLVFLLLPAVLPARFSEVNGARIWIRVAGFSIQPGEFAKILLTVFGAAYLVSKRDVLALAGRRIGRQGAQAVHRLRPAARARLRSAARGLVDLHRRARARSRPRHVAAVLRRVRRAALRDDRAGQLGDHRHPAVRRRRVRVLPAVRHGADARRRVAARLRQAARRASTSTTTTATSCASRCSASAPAGSSAPVSVAGTPNWSRCRTPTSSSPRSARRSACSAWARS